MVDRRKARSWLIVLGVSTLAAGALATPARADVTASGDANVTVLTNDVGRFFIARRCITSVGGGDPNGAGASIGPGYIYRMDVANKEVLAPEKSGQPQTGLGAFQLDMFRAQDRGDAYGGFHTLQGNICRGDPNGIFFSAGAGVVPQDDFRDDAGGGPHSTTYIWLHYTVDLADQHGVVLARVQYQYRFYSKLVQLWTRVIECPNGCNTATVAPAAGVAPPSTYPYVKMPRFAEVVAGSRDMVSHYTSITCSAADGTVLATAHNISNPQGGTSGNHCSDPRRDYVTLHGDGTVPDLKIVGRAYPADPFAPGSDWTPWEPAAGACDGAGMDKWAIMVKPAPCGDGRPSGNAAGDGPQGSNSGCLASVSNDGDARNWEMLGDDRTGGASSYKLATNGADAVGRGVYMKGWDDGNGPPTCPGLYDRFGPTGEQWANYFSYALG
jgi:hypothetical protein